MTMAVVAQRRTEFAAKIVEVAPNGFFAAFEEALKAIEFFDQNLIIVRELGDQRAEGRALWNSARAHDLLGNRSEAIARGAAALAIFEAIEDPDAAMIRAELTELRREGNRTSGPLRFYFSPSSLPWR